MARAKTPKPAIVAVKLDAETAQWLDTLPNKDFVLRYKLAGKQIKSGLLVHHDQRGGFFTLMLQPPAELAALPRAPMEMVFVLDCSGSMDGYPIEKAKGAPAGEGFACAAVSTS